MVNSLTKKIHHQKSENLPLKMREKLFKAIEVLLNHATVKRSKALNCEVLKQVPYGKPYLEWKTSFRDFHESVLLQSKKFYRFSAGVLMTDLLHWKSHQKIDFVTNINCPHLKIINISDVTVVEFTGQCYLPRLSDHGVTIRQRYWANSANCMYRMIVRNWWFVKQKFMVILSFCQEKSFRLHVLNSRPFDNFLAFNIYMQ